MELQYWGWNVLTMSMVATILFTFWQSWGLVKQTKTISQRQSARSLSLPFFSFSAAMFLNQFIYGLACSSIAISFNGGLLGILHVPVVIGYGKFRGISRTHGVMMMALVGTVIAAVVTPYKREIYLAVSLLSIAAAVLQPLEIWMRRSSGDINGRLILALASSSFFWTVYGVASWNIPMLVVSASFFIINMITFLLIRMFPNKDPA